MGCTWREFQNDVVSEHSMIACKDAQIKTQTFKLVNSLSEALLLMSHDYNYEGCINLKLVTITVAFKLWSAIQVEFGLMPKLTPGAHL